MKTAATILTFNRPQMLTQTLEALFSQSRPVDQVFVIDAGSTDHTPEVLRSLQKRFGERLCIKRTDDQGASKGFRDAMEWAFQSSEATWIWVLDDDAAPAPDALEKLLSARAASNPETGALAGLVVKADGEVFTPNLPCTINSATFEFQAVNFKDPKTYINDGIPIETTSFEGILIHRRVFETIGFHPTEYFFWFDDTDFTYSISRRFKMWLIPSAKIAHLSAFSEKEVRPPFFKAPLSYYEWPQCWRLYYRSRNFYYLLGRHASKPVALKKTIKYFARETIGAFLLRQDHLVGRLELSTKALWDGITGRMGQRVSRKPPFIRETLK